MGRYAAYSNKTNTASATVPMFNIVGGTTTRVRVTDFISGSDVPNDYATKLAFQRTSARGTQSTTVTANALDPADPAAVALYDTAWSADPTITASSTVLQIAHNARATVRWCAVPGFELVIPATSGAGLALVSVVASTAQNYAWSTMWEE